MTVWSHKLQTDWLRERERERALVEREHAEYIKIHRRQWLINWNFLYLAHGSGWPSGATGSLGGGCARTTAEAQTKHHPPIDFGGEMCDHDIRTYFSTPRCWTSVIFSGFSSAVQLKKQTSLSSWWKLESQLAEASRWMNGSAVSRCKILKSRGADGHPSWKCPQGAGLNTDTPEIGWMIWMWIIYRTYQICSTLLPAFLHKGP